MDPEVAQDQKPLVETVEELAARRALEQREAQEIADRYGLELVDMSRFRIDNDLFRSIPFDLLLRYEFVPEAQLEGRLAIVMADPQDYRAIQTLELRAGMEVEPVKGAPADVLNAIGTWPAG